MAGNDELEALGDAAALVAGQVIEPVEGMHRVISDRTFRYVGPPGAPVKIVHDAVVDGVYSSLRWAARAAGSGAASVLRRRSPSPDAVSSSPVGSRWQSAINALWGDRLDAGGNALAVGLTVRKGAHSVALDADAVAGAFPGASSHIVVLLHGLGQTERCWHRVPFEGGPSVYESLETATGVTPVALRFNSGLPVAGNGEAIAELVTELSDVWPVPNPAVSLVGYSMGGLIARSAYWHATRRGEKWPWQVANIVTVGTPHHGSPVERVVGVASRALAVPKTTRPLADFVDTRSRGIKDLRNGAGVAELWERELASMPLADGANPVRQHFVAAVVTGDPRHPIGAIVGDLMVGVSSATGKTVLSENVKVLGGRRHFDLLADRDVVEQIVAWLRTAPD